MVRQSPMQRWEEQQRLRLMSKKIATGFCSLCASCDSILPPGCLLDCAGDGPRTAGSQFARLCPQRASRPDFLASWPRVSHHMRARTHTAKSVLKKEKLIPPGIPRPSPRVAPRCGTPTVQGARRGRAET